MQYLERPEVGPPSPPGVTGSCGPPDVDTELESSARAVGALTTEPSLQPHTVVTYKITNRGALVTLQQDHYRFDGSFLLVLNNIPLPEYITVYAFTS